MGWDGGRDEMGWGGVGEHEGWNEVGWVRFFLGFCPLETTLLHPGRTHRVLGNISTLDVSLTLCIAGFYIKT